MKVFITQPVGVNGKHYQPDEKKSVDLPNDAAQMLIVRGKAVKAVKKSAEKYPE